MLNVLDRPVYLLTKIQLFLTRLCETANEPPLTRSVV